MNAPGTVDDTDLIILQRAAWVEDHMARTMRSATADGGREPIVQGVIAFHVRYYSRELPGELWIKLAAIQRRMRRLSARGLMEYRNGEFFSTPRGRETARTGQLAPAPPSVPSGRLTGSGA